MRQAGKLCLALSMLMLPCRAARADIFKLGTGGEVRGELVNPDESPREHYVIKLYAGGQVTLAASLVASVVAQRPAEVEYEKERLQYGDTAEDQWKLAEWCRKQGLSAQRKVHLERVIELDPDHAEARRLLGYEHVGDRWMTRPEIMQEKGYVKYRGSWRLPQEIDQLKEREKNDQTQREWFARLSQWRKWLDTDKAATARQNIMDIKDKAADKALITRLKDEKDYTVRALYARALANLLTSEAVKTLVQLSIDDHRDSFRNTCLDLIEKTRPPGALAMYVKALGSQDNGVVNRAAVGLGRLGDKSAIAPLIDALVTNHKFVTGSGSPGQISPTFTRNGVGGGGSGLGIGGSGAHLVMQYMRNADVLAALVKLTGQDFDYNVDAWKYWYAAMTKKDRPKINSRRD